MSVHTPNITADRVTAPLPMVAEALTRADYSLLPEGDYSQLTDGEWAHEAQSAIDGDDYSELARLIAEGQAFADYRDWQYRGQFKGAHEADVREFTDFPVYVERVAPVMGGAL